MKPKDWISKDGWVSDRQGRRVLKFWPFQDIQMFFFFFLWALKHDEHVINPGIDIQGLF